MSKKREGFSGTSADDFRITFDNGYTVSVVWISETPVNGRYAEVACFDSNDDLINMSRELWDKPGVDFNAPGNLDWSVLKARPRDVAQVINFICNK